MSVHQVFDFELREEPLCLSWSSIYDPAAATFPNFSDLVQSCLYTVITQSDSVFTVQNRTGQYFCMNYIHACTSFFKILQGSSNFCKTNHVNFSKCRGFKGIKYDILVCHEGHRYLCISLRFCIFLHFSAFYILYFRTI